MVIVNTFVCLMSGSKNRCSILTVSLVCGKAFRFDVEALGCHLSCVACDEVD